MDTRRFCRPEDSFSYRTRIADADELMEDDAVDSASPPAAAFYRTGVLSQARGSAYVESGRCKVVCAVYGPRDIPRRSDFSMRGVLFCHVGRTEFAGSGVPSSSSSSSRLRGASPKDREVSLAVQDALAATVRLESFPKSQLDVHVCVLEDGPGSAGAAVTAAGLALASGGVPMLDLLVAASSPLMTVAYLPNLEQVECVHLDGGPATPERAQEELERLVAECKRAKVDVQKCLLRQVVPVAQKS